MPPFVFRSAFALRASALALLVAGLAASPRLARAEDADVEARFKKGVELYNEADFRSAGAEFRRAYEQSKNFKILYNIAQCEFQLTNYAEALVTLERYLDEGRDRVPAARRDEVATQLGVLRGRTAAVTVTVNVAGAAVSIDERAVGTAPLGGPLRVNPGAHRVVARREGYREAASTVDVTGGEAPSVALELVEVARSSAPLTSPPPAAEPSGPSWAPAVVAWSVTGALLAGGLTTAVLAQGESSDLEAAKRSPTATRSDLEDRDASAGRLALVTDVLLGASIVGAGVATWITLATASSDAAPRTGKASAPPARTLRLAPTPFGLRLGGTF